MHLLDLPNELIFIIAHFLDEYSLNAFLQTCKRLSPLNRTLYALNADSSHSVALEWAAKHGLESTARYALQAGFSPKDVCHENFTPMALACIHGHEAIVRLLLDHGLDPNPTDGWTNYDDDYEYPMALAASHGHESIVRLLLAYGAAADTPTDEFQDTPLNMAAKGGHLGIVKLLVSVGCDVQPQDLGDHYPIIYAASGGHVEVVRFLLEMGANTESCLENGKTTLFLAALEDSAETVKLLLEYGANPTPHVQNTTVLPLVMAANYGHYAVAETLRDAMDLDRITSGDPTNIDNKLLLLAGAACGWDALVQQLLEQGCSPDALAPEVFAFYALPKTNPDSPFSKNLWKPSALALAAFRGHRGVVELLLRYNADLHERLDGEKKPNPLFVAIGGCHQNIVKVLLDHGANPNHQYSNGEPVFWSAVREPKIFELLLDHGADLELKPHQGEPLLARALRTGSVATVAILQQRIPLELPPTVNKKVPRTLFTEAAKAGEPTVQYLMDQGHKPGSEADDVLYTAVSRADVALVSLLFDKGLVSTPQTTNIPAGVEIPTGDVEAVTATIDIQLAHGFDINAHSPLYGALLKKDGEYISGSKDFYFQLLLDRGAHPLEPNEEGSALSVATERGYRKVVQILLKGLDNWNIPPERLREKLFNAEGKAMASGEMDMLPLLRRAYWRNIYRIHGAGY